MKPIVRFRDLSVPEPARRAALHDALDRICDHGEWILGKEVEEFETWIAAYCGKQHAVGVASGTSALYLALRAFGIHAGDEVVTTPMSWVATGNAIRMAGAKPVFVDIKDDLNIDPTLIENAITEHTRAIVPVHFTGLVCDMDEIRAIANRHRLLVIEDAAQAFGATFDGVPAGALGDAGAFSINPMKPFGGYGDSGAVLLDDNAAYEHLLALRYLGTVDKEVCVNPELNHKMDSLQAAMLLATRDFLDASLIRRREIAQRYIAGLADVVQCPQIPKIDPNRHIFFDFTIQTDRRDALVEHLTKLGIEVKIKHPILIPDQPSYTGPEPVKLPVARNAVRQILSLPIHEKLTDDQIDYVICQIREFYGAA